MAKADLRYEAFAFDRRFRRTGPEFRRANIVAINKVADMVLARAQEYVPVCTGRLKASAEKVKWSDKRITVRFTAPYAKEVEEGRQGTGEVWTTTYMRKGKEISYKHPPGMKPMMIQCGPLAGQWRRANFSQRTPGVYYLRNAYRDVFAERGLEAAFKTRAKPGFQFMK